jgi:hypothetical protein
MNGNDYFADAEHGLAKMLRALREKFMPGVDSTKRALL